MLVEYFVRRGFAGVMVQSEAVPLPVAVEHWLAAERAVMNEG